MKRNRGSGRTNRCIRAEQADLHVLESTHSTNRIDRRMNGIVIGIDQRLKCSLLAIRRVMATNCVDRDAVMMRGPVGPAILNWFGA